MFKKVTRYSGLRCTVSDTRFTDIVQFLDTDYVAEIECEIAIIQAYHKRGISAKNAIIQYYLGLGTNFIGSWYHGGLFERWRKAIDKHHPELEFGSKYYPAIICALKRKNRIN